MNYSELSNFEINKLVAEYHGITTSEWYHTEEDGITTLMLPINSGYKNYCNSWAGMGPIIESEKIDLSYMSNSKNWVASKFISFNKCLAPADKNPLRAAAICYLMMKESEE